MLVLTRKLGEKVVIDGNIVVTVVEANGHRVRLAFEAPDQVTILRNELVVSDAADPEAKPAELVREWEPDAASCRPGRALREVRHEKFNR